MKNIVPTKGLLEKAYDPNDFRALGHQVIDLLADHLDKVQNDKNEPVVSYKDPEDELEYWKQNLSSDSDISDVFKNILEHSISVHHPRCIGHQISVPALVSGLGGLMSDLLSNGTGVYEMGMASNAIEKIITDLIAEKIGYTSEASGFLTSGGTLANLTALLAARKAKSPSAVWEDGHVEKLAIMVSEEAHYCVDRAARILGMGNNGIIKIPVDSNFKIDTTLLNQAFSNANKNGLHVIAVIGSACSTATGSYDDLESLADFAEKNNIWFHVDGAHGAGVVFSKRYKHLVNGISRADSVVLDFHKMLMTPALTTGLFFKNGDNSYQTFQQKAQYLWDSQETREWYNSGKRTFECTKFMMSIKVYTILKAHGEEIFENNIDWLYGMADEFAKMIEKRPNFKLAMRPQANIVNFKYDQHGISGIDSNILNSKIRENLISSGKFYIVQTRIKGNLYLRCTVMNPLTKKMDFNALLDEIEHLALLI